MSAYQYPPLPASKVRRYASIPAADDAAIDARELAFERADDRAALRSRSWDALDSDDAGIPRRGPI